MSQMMGRTTREIVSNRVKGSVIFVSKFYIMSLSVLYWLACLQGRYCCPYDSLLMKSKTSFPEYAMCFSDTVSTQRRMMYNCRQWSAFLFILLVYILLLISHRRASLSQLHFLSNIIFTARTFFGREDRLMVLLIFQ